MFISTDILILKKIDVFLSQQKTVIDSCQFMKILINIITLSDCTNWIILFNDETIISVYDYVMILIESLKLLTDCDLLFELNCHSAEVFISIVDYTLNWIQLHNNINKAVIISHHIWLSQIVKYEADSYFLADSDILTTTSKLSVKQNWVR